MLLIIDNYDSFTFNLVQYLGELGQDCHVVRNDEISVDQIKQENPQGIVISPGPCTPNEAGISVAVVEQLSADYPILGVCLGHQSICQAFGASIVRADFVMHGKVSQIYHHNGSLFAAIENPFAATRYHSLVAQADSLPPCLEMTAWTADQIIMGVRHRERQVFGVQFHPESFLTRCGRQLLANFLDVGGISAPRLSQ